jgi:hypothetical protein
MVAVSKRGRDLHKLRDTQEYNKFMRAVDAMYDQQPCEIWRKRRPKWIVRLHKQLLNI